MILTELEHIQTLIHRLSQPLPGEEAQYKMAAYYRQRPQWEQIMAANPKIGAVMILLVWRENRWFITLMKRPPYDGVHGGQISFLGGKKEENDETLMHTALREAAEEGGIDLNTLAYAGALSKLYIQASHFLVHPYVFYTSEPLTLNPDINEVEEIIFIPLDTFHLFKQETTITINPERTFEAPAYIIGEHIIWGATAMMLAELEEILQVK